MKMFKTDCFAVHYPEDGKAECRALGKIKCEGCAFYKSKSEIKNNIFYKDSFDSEEEYKEAIKAYKKKYGVNNLDDLEK